jgi:signal transduction histidine kinase
MNDPDLVTRLKALTFFAEIPSEELEWILSHSELRRAVVGEIAARKGERIEHLWIVLSGHLAIHVDIGAGLHRVMEWRTGDVGGMLPYSRMKGPPGDTRFEKETEMLLVHERHFPEMICECPVFTAATVHIMLDRARTFKMSELQDEKMISLGKLAAGLAHELNNPASALVRGAKTLLESIPEADTASRMLGAVLSDERKMAAVERTRDACLGSSPDRVLSPLERADREDDFADWLEGHGLDPAYAASLSETSVDRDALDALAGEMPKETVEAAIRWIAAGCTMRSLATDVERAATRIYELVGAVKRFTYMDKLAGPDSADVETGLRDTVRVIASKAKTKGASISLEVAPDLPRANAKGGELNQVWLNLIDNALDAIPDSGHIDIRAYRENDSIVVHVIDNGAGIPADALPRIFDPFFTTKPPGQGTGLGLDIARRLLRRYHGDISASSRPGRTEFIVRLQIEKQSTAPME